MHKLLLILFAAVIAFPCFCQESITLHEESNLPLRDSETNFSNDSIATEMLINQDSKTLPSSFLKETSSSEFDYKNTVY